jgi:hypothetical protein
LFRKLIVSIVVAYATAAVSQTACSNIPLGPLAPLNGFVPSATDAWHQDISAVPVDKLSSWILTSTADLGGAHLAVNFSSVAGGNLGIPYTVVDSQTTPGIALPITVNPAQSDITLVPIPSALPVEQSTGQCPLTGTDRRALILDRNQCVVYEIYQADQCTTGSWTASNMAIWDLTTTEARPYGYTSADAAGLSVFEGLIRYDEIVAGVINHAIRFTAVNTQTDAAHGLFAAPATHAAGTTKSTDNVIGMRLRLKANYDISGFSTTNQIILTALKKYGMILADNGPNLSLGGTPDTRWDDTDLAALTNVVSSGLQVVQMGTLYDATTAPKGAAPVISSFSASSTTIPAGGSVTLTPTVTGASYSYIDNAGFTRGPITVSPAATTTYTLTSRNQFGTASASVTVTVGGTQTVPTLTFAAIPAQTFGTAPFAVSASSQSAGAITYSLVSGPATIAGSTVTITGIGTVVVKATQAAAGTYNSATATTSFTVSAANPGLAFVPIPNQPYPTAAFAVSTTTASTGSITYSVVSGPAAISGNTVTLTGTGTVVLQASQAATGNYTSATATTSFLVQSGAIVGGHVFIPTPSSVGIQGFFLHVAQSGNAYIMNPGSTTDPNTGIWFANASACESSPTTCTWTPMRTGEPVSSGSYTVLHQLFDIDSTHELGIFSYSPAAGGCTDCSIQILNSATKTFTPITLPGERTGESPACLTRDSTGIFYTMLNYHAGIWKSTDNTATTWTEVSAAYATLPGLATASGNIYTCRVFGNRIYFGGEGGVMSCNLAFSSCSQDYLPFGSGKRNFLSILADVNESSATNPTMMLECCKQNPNIPNYVPYSRFTNGTWTQMTTSSGLPPYVDQYFFDPFSQATGTGAARRFYVMFQGSAPPTVVYKSTDSTGTSFARFLPTQWPTATASYSPTQISADPQNGSLWTLFSGTSQLGIYITP